MPEHARQHPPEGHVHSPYGSQCCSIRLPAVVAGG
jgi:hypothetical protein